MEVPHKWSKWWPAGLVVVVEGGKGGVVPVRWRGGGREGSPPLAADVTPNTVTSDGSLGAVQA